MKICNLLGKIIFLFATLITGFMFFSNLFIDGYTIDYVQNVKFIYGGSVVVLLCLILVFVIRHHFKNTDINSNVITLAFYLSVWLLGVFIVLNAKQVLTNDANKCFEIAKQFSLDNLSDASIEYLTYFPFNFSTVLTDYLIYNLFNEYAIVAFRIMNVSTLILGYWLLEKVVIKSGWKSSLFWYRTLVLFWLPQLFQCSLVYGWIIGFFFSCLGLYAFIYIDVKFTSKIKPWYFLLGCAFFLMIFFKLNFAIVAIACILGTLLSFREIKRILLIAIVLFLGMNASGWLAESELGIDSSRVMPVSLYFVMSNYRNEETTVGKNLYLDGWVDGTPQAIYNKYSSENTSNLTDELNNLSKSLLLEQFTEAIHNPLDSVIFYLNKFISTWFIQDYGMFNDYPIRIDEDYPWFILLLTEIASSLVLLGTFVTSLVNLKEKKWNCFAGVFILTFLGFIAYYLISETQSRYVIVSISLLFPISSCGLETFYRFWRSRLTKSKRKCYLITTVSCVLFLLVNLCGRIQSVVVKMFTAENQDNGITSIAIANSISGQIPVKSQRLSGVELYLGKDDSDVKLSMQIFDNYGNLILYEDYYFEELYGKSPINLTFDPVGVKQDYSFVLKENSGKYLCFLVNSEGDYVQNWYVTEKIYASIFDLDSIHSNNFLLKR